jgi:hypothetical protein
MKKFRYEAVDRKGVDIEGILEAQSLEEVILRLLQDKCYPTRVEELTQQSFIALGRLENLKALRDRLQPQQPTSVVVPKPERKVNWVIVVIVLLWLAAILVYIITGAF